MRNTDDSQKHTRYTRPYTKQHTSCVFLFHEALEQVKQICSAEENQSRSCLLWSGLEDFLG
jgi:hypothetical protein